jgi:hypothetical protein
VADGNGKADWPQISDIIPNHDGDRPDGTAILTGLRTELQLDVPVSVEFGARQLVWIENNVRTEFEYEAFSLGRRLFLVDAMPPPPDRRSMTMIWDVGAMRALVIETTFPVPQEAQTPVLDRLTKTGSQSAVRVRYRQGGLGGVAVAQFSRSTALVGRFLRYRYSDTHEYDHIYHSDRYYSWFCREGPDRGLGDFEECDVFELHERLYLVSWREKLLPCVGIMVEDHERMRALGKICGADAYTGVIANTRVGASISYGDANCAASPAQQSS